MRLENIDTCVCALGCAPSQVINDDGKSDSCRSSKLQTRHRPRVGDIPARVCCHLTFNARAIQCAFDITSATRALRSCSSRYVSPLHVIASSSLCSHPGTRKETLIVVGDASAALGFGFCAGRGRCAVRRLTEVLLRLIYLVHGCTTST